MLDPYSEGIRWLCYAEWYILLAWFGCTCPLSGKVHCKSIQSCLECRQHSPPPSSKHQMREYLLEEWCSSLQQSSETCRINAKMHWSRSSGMWRPNTLLRHFMLVFPLICHLYVHNNRALEYLKDYFRREAELMPTRLELVLLTCACWGSIPTGIFVPLDSDVQEIGTRWKLTSAAAAQAQCWLRNNTALPMHWHKAWDSNRWHGTSAWRLSVSDVLMLNSDLASVLRPAVCFLSLWIISLSILEHLVIYK